MTDSMNEIMNEGVCRTAPATPGLIKISLDRVPTMKKRTFEVF